MGEDLIKWRLQQSRLGWEAAVTVHVMSSEALDQGPHLAALAHARDEPLAQAHSHPLAVVKHLHVLVPCERVCYIVR